MEAMRLAWWMPLLVVGCSAQPAREPPFVGPDLRVVFDFSAPPGSDLAASDLAAPLDLAPPPDFGMGPDLTVAPDLAAPPDLAVPADLAMPLDQAMIGADLAMARDLALGPADLAMAPADLAQRDLTQPRDFARAPDLARPPDLTVPRDLTQPRDLTPPPDLALPKATLEINYCVVQSPKMTTTKVNTATELLFGQLFQFGKTDVAMNGPAPGIKAQLGWGLVGSDPRIDPAWSWIDAVPNPDPGYKWNLSNDEYQARLTLGKAGTFAYVYRVSVTGGAGYTYCDTVGNGSNMGLPPFDPQKAGRLVVSP